MKKIVMTMMCVSLPIVMLTGCENMSANDKRIASAALVVTFTAGYHSAVDVTECTFSYLSRQDCFVPLVTRRRKKKPE